MLHKEQIPLFKKRPHLEWASSNTVQILCIGTDRSQQTVQTKIRLLLKKQSAQGLRCLPFHQHLLDALMQCYIKLFYFLGQLWQLFEVSQILEFLRYVTKVSPVVKMAKQTWWCIHSCRNRSRPKDKMLGVNFTSPNARGSGRDSI